MAKAAAIVEGRGVPMSCGLPSVERGLRGRGEGYHQDRTPAHGYEPRCEAAIAAFAKSWCRS
jgi:hypothetical protein